MFVIISNDKRAMQEEDAEWSGFVQTIKNSITKQTLQFRQMLSLNEKKFGEAMKMNFIDIASKIHHNDLRVGEI